MVIKKACVWSHAYKDVWHPIVSDESLICEQEETNEYDRNVASIMFENCLSEMFVEHVPFNWSKFASKFLQFPNPRIRVVLTEKQVNCSAGFGLQMPVDYIF